MKQAFLLKTSLTLFSILLFAGARASDDTQKEIRKTISVNNNVRMMLDVGFTTVHVETWDQSTIDITVKLSTSARSEDRAKEMLEKIDVAIDESSSIVTLRISLGKTNCGNNEDYDISATIKMPAGGSLEGKASFGNVDVTNLKGACKLIVEYGNLHTGDLSATNNSLKISFGNADIKSFGGGNLNCEYGSVHVESMSGKNSVDCAFGNLDVNSVEAACQSININAEYGDVHLYLAAGAGFTFDTAAEYGKVKLPANVKMNTSKNDYTSERFTGTIGSGTGTLTVHASFGNVIISQ